MPEQEEGGGRPQVGGDPPAHLHDLAAAAGQDGWKAWAYPVSVDLLLVAS
ncbi:DUF2637 domain-containing protein, partial [Streptomyces clavifer]